MHGIARRGRWLKALPPPLVGCVALEPIKRVRLSKRKDIDEDDGA